MHVTTRNVNTAFLTLVRAFHEAEKGKQSPIPLSREPSRNGDVLRVAQPVLITYTHPRERVLFNAARDANPFFHMYEALWMLAGRNDVASVAYYAKQMMEYSDDGRTLNGAYGYRWRRGGYRDYEDTYQGYISSGDVDQLDLLVAHLKADPNSRRAVLQMWNVEDDLLKIGQPSYTVNNIEVLRPGSKDVCCNLSVMFSLRIVDDGSMSFKESSPLVPVPGTEKIGRTYLDMTVTNRSNDLIWGLLGANYVHFSFLQEYVAARLGCEVGLYHHFTNNLHAYSWNWKPEEWLKSVDQVAYGPTPGYDLRTVPLVRDPEVFDREVKDFVAEFDGSRPPDPFADRWTEPFLRDVARPMLLAFSCRKQGVPRESYCWDGVVKAGDWRAAATNWLERRRKK